jgi:hypothetical protein
MATVLPELTDPLELLFRQCCPGWFKVAGRLCGLAFRAKREEKYQVSVDRSSLTTAQDAFLLHAKGKQPVSVGTWAVTVAECKGCMGAAEKLRCHPDPRPSSQDEIANPAHSYIDFSDLPSNKQKERAGSELARYASDRGCLFAAADIE